MLLSASQDASVHVFLVARLVDEDDSGSIGKPYGTLKDHTLGIRNVAVGKTSGSHGGRCWTTSDDGTVKVTPRFPVYPLPLGGLRLIFMIDVVSTSTLRPPSDILFPTLGGT